MSRQYCTQADVEAYLKIASGSDTSIPTHIEGISRLIDNATGTQFIKDDGTIRFFDGNGSDTLIIDDCVDIDLIRIGDYYGDSFTTLDSVDFKMIPNKITPPVQRVLLKNGVFTRGKQNIEITADWGYSSIAPEDIKFATIVLSAGAIQGKPGSTPVKSERIGSYQVTYADDKGWSDFEQILSILNKYKRYSL